MITLAKKPTFNLTLIVTMIFGLITHAFIFFNPSYSHDSLLINQAADNVHQIALGRYLQPLYRMIRGNITSTWLIGLVSLFFLAIATYFIQQILQIKSKRGIVLTCGVLTTNLSLIFSYATYSPWADIYMLALLCCALAVYIGNKHKYGFVVGSALISICLALYQAYVSAAVALLLLRMIKNILEDANKKETVFEFLRGCLMIVIGGIIYYCLLFVTTSAANIPLSQEYNGISGLGDYSGYSFVSILKLFMSTYYRFAAEILRYKTPYFFLHAGIILSLSIMSLAQIILFLKQRKTLGITKIASILLTVSILPLGLNCVYIMSKGLLHSLMTYSFYFLYVLAIMVYECKAHDGAQELGLTGFFSKAQRLFERHSYKITATIIGILILNNIVFANGIYTNKYLQEQGTLSFMTRIVDRAERVDGYVPNSTPIIFWGNTQKGEIDWYFSGFANYSGVGANPQRLAVTYEATYHMYLSHILGYPVPECPEEVKDELKESSEILDMPSFPNEGCCKMIGDVLVIKLSD